MVCRLSTTSLSPLESLQHSYVTVSCLPCHVAVFQNLKEHPFLQMKLATYLATFCTASVTIIYATPMPYPVEKAGLGGLREDLCYVRTLFVTSVQLSRAFSPRSTGLHALGHRMLYEAWYYLLSVEQHGAGTRSPRRVGWPPIPIVLYAFVQHIRSPCHLRIEEQCFCTQQRRKGFSSPPRDQSRFL